MCTYLTIRFSVQLQRSDTILDFLLKKSRVVKKKVKSSTFLTVFYNLALCCMILHTEKTKGQTKKK